MKCERTLLKAKMSSTCLIYCEQVSFVNEQGGSSTKVKIKIMQCQSLPTVLLITLLFWLISNVSIPNPFIPSKPLCLSGFIALLGVKLSKKKKKRKTTFSTSFQYYWLE